MRRLLHANAARGSAPKRRSRERNSWTAAAKIGSREVRPHHRSEHQLGVGAFPEQKIAQALFAAGADEQIDIVERRAPPKVPPDWRCLSGRLSGGQDRVARGIIDREPQAAASRPAQSRSRILQSRAAAGAADGRDVRSPRRARPSQRTWPAHGAGRCGTSSSARRLRVAGGASCRKRTRRPSALQMPRSGAASTARRNASAPARCPATRGNPRAEAQRPLPSMMIAAWRQVEVLCDISELFGISKLCDIKNDSKKRGLSQRSRMAWISASM